jgi:hypothetical protein
VRQLAHVHPRPRTASAASLDVRMHWRAAVQRGVGAHAGTHCEGGKDCETKPGLRAWRARRRVVRSSRKTSSAGDADEVLWTCGRGYDGGDAVGGGQQVVGGGARRQVHEVEGVAVTALSTRARQHLQHLRGVRKAKQTARLKCAKRKAETRQRTTTRPAKANGAPEGDAHQPLLIKNSVQEYSSSTGCLKAWPVRGGMPVMNRALLSKRYQRPYVFLFLLKRPSPRPRSPCFCRPWSWRRRMQEQLLRRGAQHPEYLEFLHPKAKKRRG